MGAPLCALGGEVPCAAAQEGTDMDPIDTDARHVLLSTRRDELRYQVQAWGAELSELHRRAKAGDFDDLRELKRVTRELLTASKALAETEIDIDKELLRQRGRHGPHDIDMEAARRELAGRLDRLRAALGEGGVSQRDE
ncbi:MAG: hypothetical protein AAF330_05235 [Pseudomonadota bacterium]